MSKRLTKVWSPSFGSAYICGSCRAKLSSSEAWPRSIQKRWITKNHIRRIKSAEEEWAERADAVLAGQKQSILSLLEERGYVNQIIGGRDELDHLLTQRRCGVYCGVDPTAPSLHVGHMVPFMALGWMFIHGYSSTFLLGGSTAVVGDPTHRLKARDKTPATTRKANMASMHMQLKRLGKTMESYAERKGYTREWAWKRALVNNSDWWRNTTMVDVLKTMGTGIRIGAMLGRDTVKNKMEKGDGMSFAEFTYPIMQAWDWWELFKKGTQVQIGGADQFGNILAGAEAVKYMAKYDPEYQSGKAPDRAPNHNAQEQKETQSCPPSATRALGKAVPDDPMGFTVPLLTTSAGEKFGKSAGNAIWLDKDMTSTFELYQFFLRCADADVERYLKLFTFLPISAIAKTMEEHMKDQSKRVAQHKLAYEFVEMIHGLGEAQEVEKQHRQLFSRDLSIKDIRQVVNPAESRVDSSAAGSMTDMSPSLDKYAPQTNAENMGPMHMKLPRSLVENQSPSKILWSAGLVSSRSEGQRLINNGGAHIGSTSDRRGGDMGDGLSFAPITTWKPEETARYIIDGNLLILRVGKWKIKIINIISDEDYEKECLSCPGWKEPEGDQAGRTDYKDAQRQREEALKARKEKIGAASGERRGAPSRGRLVGESKAGNDMKGRKRSPFGVVESASWE